MAKASPAGTVNVLERTRGGLTVVVVRDMIHVSWHPEPIADWYRITTSTGFTAQFRACYADGCVDGTITPCACDRRKSMPVNAWLAHSRATCHGWHDGRAEAFAELVLRSTAPERGRPVGMPRGRLPGHYVPCAWPIERRGPKEMFVDGRPRPVDYGYDVHSPIVPSPIVPTAGSGGPV